MTEKGDGITVEERRCFRFAGEDQPDPKPNAGTPVWEMVIGDMGIFLLNAEYAGDPVPQLVVDDMRVRDAVGRERYGTPLQLGNGRSFMLDAYQEILDTIVYWRGMKSHFEGEGEIAEERFVEWTKRYHALIGHAIWLRKQIVEWYGE